ncbi:MAG: LLM class flavin-dependent oxidoreductase [Gammaproteobacteria bacterium]
MLIGTIASPAMLAAPHRERSARVARILDAGIDHVFIADHVSFHNGLGMDGLINAATLTALDPRLRVVVGVYLLALRHPVVVARQLATIAESAPGQLLLGVGVGGEDRNEIAMCGIDPRTRGRRTDECLAVLEGLASGESFSFDGEFFAFERAIIHGLQLWVGIDSNRERARARLAKGMERFYHMPFERFEKYSPYGTAPEVADFIARYRDGGCTLFNIMPIAETETAGIDAVAEIRRRLT